jgi:hypothetical protein
MKIEFIIGENYQIYLKAEKNKTLPEIVTVEMTKPLCAFKFLSLTVRTFFYGENSKLTTLPCTTHNI